MPTLAELQKRTKKSPDQTTAVKSSSEALVRDLRSQLRPTHVVEQKLTVALRKSKP